MKKNFIAMVTVVLLCALTTACGGSSSTSSNNSDIPSDGVLGENGREIYDLMNEFMITIDQQKEELQSHYTFNENQPPDEKLVKEYEALKARQEALKEEIPQKVKAAEDILRGKEIVTVIEEGAPLKIVEPFKIVSLRGMLTLAAECTVELTKESAVKYMDQYNSNQLMGVSCEDKDKNDLQAPHKLSLRIGGGTWPDNVYPVGTRFIIHLEIYAGHSSKGGELHVSKELFQTKQITIHWTANTFVLEKRKLGPIELGRPISNLPVSVEGLYDKYEHKTETHEDDMDGEWVEDYYLFTYKGKEAFRATIFEGNVYSISLYEGASKVYDRNGIFVGYSARELFNKKRMEWQTDFAGWVFGTSGDYTYFASSNDLANINAEVPRKADDFKEDAKIVRIDYR